MNRGIIICSGLKLDKIFEYVIFLFFVVMLYVLCVFCLIKWKLGEFFKLKLVKRGRWRVERFLDEDMFFMMVVGLLYLMFFNYYIYYNYGVNVSVGCVFGGIVFDFCGVGFD